MTSEDALGNAGYAITGSGGGGSGGKYVFASLEELDSIITDWTKILDELLRDGDGMAQASYVRLRPADDEMSTRQSSAVGDSFGVAITHIKDMQVYTRSYLEKLKIAREQYLADDTEAAARFGRNDGI